MGRKLIYKTKKAKIEARRKTQMAYYWRNQKQRQKKALDRYYRLKEAK